jgi:hypothetical protein
MVSREARAVARAAIQPLGVAASPPEAGAEAPEPVPGELIIQTAKPEIRRLIHFRKLLLPNCGKYKRFLCRASSGEGRFSANALCEAECGMTLQEASELGSSSFGILPYCRQEELGKEYANFGLCGQYSWLFANYSSTIWRRRSESDYLGPIFEAK